MKPEDKELLLKYLCMALPYKIVCQMSDGFIINDSPFYDSTLSERHIELFRKHKGFYIKPYLRPLSTMTEEELVELNCLCYHNISVQDDMLCGYICGIEIDDVQDFLLRYHFDFIGLIPQGLAIAVTEENNPYNMEA